jgi:hydroxymethylbilane synthase
LRIRDDLKIENIRGDILTRIDILMNGEFDGIVLAAAGLRRLNIIHKASQIFKTEEIIPSVGQGIIAIQTMKNSKWEGLLRSISSEISKIQWETERTFLNKIHGGCNALAAAYAKVTYNSLILNGIYATDNNPRGYKSSIEGSLSAGKQLGYKLANLLIEKASLGEEN